MSWLALGLSYENRTVRQQIYLPHSANRNGIFVKPLRIAMTTVTWPNVTNYEHWKSMQL